jgi:hypothetical protein
VFAVQCFVSPIATSLSDPIGFEDILPVISRRLVFCLCATITQWLVFGVVSVPIALLPMAGCLIYITKWCLALRLEASDMSGSTRSFAFHMVPGLLGLFTLFLRQRYLQTAAVGCDRPNVEDAFYGVIQNTIIGGQREGQEHEPRWIHVCMISGEIVLRVEMEPSLTVWDLKLRVLATTGTEPSRQEMFKDGEREPLRGSSMLAELRIPGSALDDVLNVTLTVMSESPTFLHLTNVLDRTAESASEFSMDFNAPWTS